MGYRHESEEAPAHVCLPCLMTLAAEFSMTAHVYYSKINVWYIWHHSICLIYHFYELVHQRYDVNGNEWTFFYFLIMYTFVTWLIAVMRVSEN